MTGTQEPDLHEQHRGATQEEGDEEEEGEKVHVSVEREEREQDGEEDEEEEEEEKEELPYPDLAPVVLLALTQTSPPRSWCLRAVCHPYPSPPGVQVKHCKRVCVCVCVCRMSVFIAWERHCLFVFELCTFSKPLYLQGSSRLDVYFTFKHKGDGEVTSVHVRVCVCVVGRPQVFPWTH